LGNINMKSSAAKNGSLSTHGQSGHYDMFNLK